MGGQLIVRGHREQAFQQLRELSMVVGDRYNNLPVVYRLLYNVSYGLVPDLQEVFKQKADEVDASHTISKRYDVLWDVVSSRPSSLDQAKLVANQAISTIFANAKDGITKSIAASYSRDAQYNFIIGSNTEKEYTEHFAIMSSYIGKGYGDLLIGYSQGNFFVNKTYDSLIGKFSTGPVEAFHIAPPTQTVRGKYILSKNDRVITELLKVFGNVLSPSPADLAIPRIDENDDGHGLITSYLNPAYSGREIVRSNILESLSKISLPPCSRKFKFTNTFSPVISTTPGFFGQSGSYIVEFTLAGISSTFTGTADSSDVTNFKIDFTSDQDVGDFNTSAGVVIYDTSPRANCPLCVSSVSSYYYSGYITTPRFSFSQGKLISLSFGYYRAYNLSPTIIGTRISDGGSISSASSQILTHRYSGNGPASQYEGRSGVGTLVELAP
ncbi:hypothetical protein OF829_08880 [Sphingomonas sp. LB-2]|nr:hypothetical protein [Sphingomonas caeni]